VQDLNDKVAVVTGGASGIGLALAERFAAAGMKLVLGDIEGDALERAATALRVSGAEVATLVCDVSHGDEVDALRDLAVDTFGTAHVLCNNAGVGGGGLLDGLTDNDWNWVLGVNLMGVVHGMRAFLPLLKAQGEGHVVNTASVAGLFAAPFMGPYSASKFAVVAISETLFHELKMTGSDVGVSVLCPAWVNTKIHQSGRNRPERFLDAGVEEPTGDTLSMIAAVIESGMPPADVAECVLDAIVAKRFYILTHPDTKIAIRSRMEAILAEEDPPFFFPQ